MAVLDTRGMYEGNYTAPRTDEGPSEAVDVLAALMHDQAVQRDLKMSILKQQEQIGRHRQVEQEHAATLRKHLNRMGYDLAELPQPEDASPERGRYDHER